MRKYTILKRLTRYREIINILIKYGFEIIVERAHLLKFFKNPFRKKKIKYSIPTRVRNMLEELGPTFIKFGQILSTRPDLIPIEYIKELEKLQDEVDPEPFEVMKEVIEKEISKKIEDVFEEFNSVPVASASISQVYKAKYKKNIVAVKVKKPGIKEKIFLDIQILYDIASLIEKFIKESQIYQPVKIVKEFEKSIKKEMDFILEAKNIEMMKEKMKDDERIFIPKVYKEISSENLLVMEYVDGIKISNVDEWTKYVDREKVLRNGIDIILKQIFQIGFFHGDPHPGNIFILKDGKISLIDFGIIGRIDEEKKYYLISLISGILKGDTDKIIRTLKLMDAMERNINFDQIKEDIEEMVEIYRDMPLKDIKIGEIMEKGFELMRKNKLKIPTSFSLIGKSFITLEGLCYLIQPDFKLIESIEPFFLEFVERKVKISYFYREMRKNFESFQYLIKEIPEGIESFFKVIKKGNLNISLEEKTIQILERLMRRRNLHISFSIIISAILISSTLLFIFNKKPLFYGISIPAIAGLFITLFLLFFITYKG